MLKLSSLIILLLLSTACIKTADQVHREKRFDAMTEQLKDSQGLVADMVTQMKDMQSQLDRMNGRLEELEHRQSQTDPAQLKQMDETLKVVTTQQESQTTQLLQIQNELKEQRAFIEKVTKTLTESTKPQAAQKKSAKKDLAEGLDLVAKDKYKEARTVLEALIDHNDLTAGEKNKVLHGLGRVEYYTGNTDKALVYFSKLFTKYPKSSLAPSSLLFIGRSLKKSGKKDEAKEAFLKVVEDYKGTKEANAAAKEL